MSKHRRLGIRSFSFGRFYTGPFLVASPSLNDTDIADTDLFDFGLGYTADQNAGKAGIDVKTVQVTDTDAPHTADSPALRTAHSCTQTQKDGRIDNITHSDI